ncbi:hypothetical protein FACS189496_3300 [Bacilli bacterium]|nr:hypothetical protein FACS189496_3300 [Bacilli bacterium]
MRNKITRLLIILPIALFFVPFVSSCANGEVYIDVSNTCLYCNDISNNQTTVKFHNLSQKSKPALIQDQYGIDSNDRNSKITNNDNFNFSITKDSITFKYIKPFSEEDVKWSFKIDTNKRLFSLTLDLISTNKKTDKEIFD